MNTIEKLDKDCLDAHIKELIRLTEQEEILKQKINFQKENIKIYAKENGILHSDSKYTVSLVFTPKIVWNDPELDDLEKTIEEYGQEINHIAEEQKVYKDAKVKILERYKNNIKKYCEENNKSVTQVYRQFDFISSLEENYHIRIEDTSKVKESKKTWIFKKE